MTNTITITGRLAQDPELRFTQSGKALCNISIPDQKRKKDESGQWVDASATTWFRVTLFDDAAEAFAEAGRKGDEVVATGRLVTREWQGKEGDTRQSLELDFARVGIIPKANAQRTQAPQGDAWGQPQQSNGGGFGGHDQAPPF